MIQKNLIMNHFMSLDKEFQEIPLMAARRKMNQRGQDRTVH